jgi:hypothetical protein
MGTGIVVALSPMSAIGVELQNHWLRLKETLGYDAKAE